MADAGQTAMAKTPCVPPTESLPNARINSMSKAVATAIAF
jgi:hypothetical protein